MSGISFDKENPLGRKKYQVVVFLWLMREGSIYGYDLAARYEKLTKGHMKVSYGIVYPFLRRMEKRGLVASATDESTGRVNYTLTPNGKNVLKQLLGELEESRHYFDETLLGFFSIYSELFGQKALRELLSRATRTAHIA
jgi:DNA-binding PadR family transcriptional regulator